MTSRFDSDEILSLGLVADILSVSKETVRKWEKNGTLPQLQIAPSGTRGYCWKDLQKFPAVSEIAHSQWGSEKVVKPLRSYRSIELFAGAGGLALGMEMAGFENVVFNEFNHDACETLRKNRPEWNVIEGDVAKIDFTRYKDIDFVSGGFLVRHFRMPEIGRALMILAGRCSSSLPVYCGKRARKFFSAKTLEVC